MNPHSLGGWKHLHPPRLWNKRMGVPELERGRTQGLGASENPPLVSSASMDTVPRTREAERSLVQFASSLLPGADSCNPLMVPVLRPLV